MQVPRFGLLKSSSWWSRPSVWPTSWQETRFRHAVVLYGGLLWYVSLSLTVPWTMWLPVVSQIWATPSQPVLPYDALQISSWPSVGRQFRGLVPPATIVVFSTLEAVQSDEVVARIGSQVLLT